MTWKAPVDRGVTVTVIGITKCLGEPEHPGPDDSGMCLTKGMSLPSSAERVVGHAPAKDGALSWTWAPWGDIGGALAFDRSSQTSYYGFVLVASTGGDRSEFAIAGNAGWCRCTY